MKTTMSKIADWEIFVDPDMDKFHLRNNRLAGIRDVNQQRFSNVAAISRGCRRVVS
jgi:hypothetical protein